MIPFDVHGAAPTAGGAPGDQARQCLKGLAASGVRAGDVLSLTFFVDATEPAAYAARKAELIALVAEEFAPHVPPTAVVAQPPEGAAVALEAAVLRGIADGVRIVRDGRSTLVTAGEVRQVHGVGCSLDGAGDDAAAQAEEAFRAVEEVLGREGLHFGHVVRQWGYIEGVLRVRSAGGRDRQGYQAYNDVRSKVYGRCEFPFGYPAASGIGQAAGGVVIEFIAVGEAPDVRVVPLSNPKQVVAHRYSDGVLIGAALDVARARCAPKFERAKFVARGADRTIFVSGTAAIIGEESVHPGDLAAQTRTTIENITELIRGERLSHLRAYVKRAEDIPEVRRICEAAWGAIPARYVRADVCRDELLVELEGALTVRKDRGSR